MYQQTDFEAQVINGMAKLRAQALALCRNKTLADDLVQETVYRALLHQKQFKEGSVGAWMCVIMRNYFYSSIRRIQEYEDPEGGYARKQFYVDDPVSRIELRQVMQIVDLMPEAWRDPIYLQAFDGLTSAEIAERAENRAVCKNTIRTRLNRAREALAKAGYEL